MRVSFNALIILVIASLTQAPAGADTSLAEQGRRIYQEGILPSGGRLVGVRFGNAAVEGEDAACVKCHRRSGMGGLEGNTPVPPVTGRFLFAGKDKPLALLDTRSPRDITQAHAPYTDASLTKAVTRGTNVQGRPMSVLMPRYALKSSDMKALAAYLKQLSSQMSPGVGQETVRFATIVTPDVDPAHAQALEKMLRTAFQQRNFNERPHPGQMRMPLQMLPHTRRDWRLSVWALKGAPSTWEAQLADYYRREPVFAVISGLSHGDWEPVQAFCDGQQIPCLFPSVDYVPAKQSYQALYFSRGVGLEAQVLSRYLSGEAKPAVSRIVQVFREDTVGRNAAMEFRQALVGTHPRLEDRVLNLISPASVLNDLHADDTVVFWLQPNDLKALAQAAPELPARASYFSGRLLGIAASGIPESWKAGAKLVYPFEVGAKRDQALRSAREWLRNYHLPTVDETMQSEVFFNLLLLTDLTTQLLDNYYRDYLIERAEDMLSQGENVTAYPRLSLGTGQRFASKGAYIAHIESGGAIKADTDWIIP